MAGVEAPLLPLVTPPQRPTTPISPSLALSTPMQPVAPTSPPGLALRSPKRMAASACRPSTPGMLSARQSSNQANVACPTAPFSACGDGHAAVASKGEEVTLLAAPLLASPLGSSVSTNPGTVRASLRRSKLMSVTERKLSIDSTQVGSDSEATSLDGDSEWLSTRNSIKSSVCGHRSSSSDMSTSTSSSRDQHGGTSTSPELIRGGPSTSPSVEEEADHLRYRKPLGWAAAGLHRTLARHSSPGIGEPRTQYYTQKLLTWFQQAVDLEGTGKVTFRFFLAALRRQPRLQLFLADQVGLELSEEQRKAFSRVRVAGLLALPVDLRASALLSERRRIKIIFEEMCHAGGDAVDWESFLGFFQRRGLVMEIKLLEEETATTQTEERLRRLLPAVSPMRCSGD